MSGSPTPDHTDGRLEDGQRPEPPTCYRELLDSLPTGGTLPLGRVDQSPLREDDERIGDPAAVRIVRLALEVDAAGPPVERALRRLLESEGREALRDILGEIRRASDTQQWMWKFARDPGLLLGDEDENEPESEAGPEGSGGEGTRGSDGEDGGGGATSGTDSGAGMAPESVEALARSVRSPEVPERRKAEAASVLGSAPSRIALETLLDLAVRQEDPFQPWTLQEKSPSTLAAVQALSWGVWRRHPAAQQASHLARSSGDPDLMAAAGASGHD